MMTMTEVTTMDNNTLVNFTIDNSCSIDSYPNYEPGTFCPPTHDNVSCWPPSLANTTVYIPCLHLPTVQAVRQCQPDGQWAAKADYGPCLAAYGDTTEDFMTSRTEDAKNLSVVIFIGGIISLVVLLISFFIFVRFKSLHCPRTTIHKNLIVSFILRFLIIIVILEPVIFGHTNWVQQTEWICKVMTFLLYFAYLGNFCWMLVEGLFLHLILVLRPLSNEKTPFVFFYFVGWGLPLIITIAWSITMHFDHNTRCWSNHFDTPIIFIIFGPILLALFVNTVILLNLVRLVMQKLCSGNATERRKICRAIKSTIVLVFLLGTINLLFFFGPLGEDPARLAYRYINAVLPPCQGIFIALLYCVMNAEVRRAVKKRWVRFRDSRSMHGNYSRRRSSRTSLTMFVSTNPQCNGAEHANLMEMQTKKETNGHHDMV